MKLISRSIVCMLATFSIINQTNTRLPDYENSWQIAVAIAGTVALTKGAYDAISYFDEMFLPFCQFKFEELLYKKPKLRNKTPVAFLEFQGDIGGELYDNFLRKLEQCALDDSIKGVFVRIDSGGGCPAESSGIYQELAELRKIKPVVAFVTCYCCSGAYYVACGATRILAVPEAFIGSIGVWREVVCFTDTIQGKFGPEKGQVEHKFIKTGKYKIIGNLYEPLTDDERAYLQRLNDQTYDAFCKVVELERGLEPDKRAIWADGKIF